MDSTDLLLMQKLMAQQKSSGRANLVDAIASGLAGVVATQNKRVGNTLPQQIQAEYQARNAQRQTENRQGITELVGLTKAGQTNDLKDYAAYSQQESGAGRKPLSFLEWQKTLKQAGATAPDPFTQLFLKDPAHAAAIMKQFQTSMGGTGGAHSPISGSPLGQIVQPGQTVSNGMPGAQPLDFSTLHEDELNQHALDIFGNPK